MKNTLKILGITALAVLIIISCSDSDDDPEYPIPPPIGGPTAGLEFTPIESNGEVTSYSVSKGVANASAVVIPAVHGGLPVTEVKASGFASYYLTSIVIPESVMKIGENAFYNCSNLTWVIIPTVTTSIGNLAFQGCSKLTMVFYGGADNAAWARISIGTGNTLLTDAERYYYSNEDPDTNNIHWYYAGESPKLWIRNQGLEFTLINGTAYAVSKGMATATEIVIPDRYEFLPVTEIWDFRYYTNLTNITIPDSVTRIGGGAFNGCSGLTNITIPDSVTSIDYGTFSGCSGLMSVIIGNSVESIGNGAFYGCSGLTSITIPASVTSIDYNAFSGCSGLTSITIPASVMSIDGFAFLGCSGLESITVANGNTVYRSEENCLIRIANNTLISGCKNSVIPNSVTSIGDGAFYGCIGLTSVTIPASVTSIGDGAFYGCTGLMSVTIGNGMTSIDNYAFYGNYQLTRVYYGGADSEAWSEIIIGIENDSLINTTRYYYSAEKKAGNYWRYVNELPEVWDESDIAPGSRGLAYTLIYDETRYEVSKGTTIQTNIIIPDEYNGLPVTRIMNNGFSDHTAMTSITIGKNVTSIGDAAFSGCSGLTNIMVTNGNTVYRSEENCLIRIADTTLILGCKNSVIPASVTSIGYGAFYGCTGLTSITIPASVTSIGAYAFWGCSGLTSVTIPNSVTSIVNGMFWGCSGLTSITIPASVTSIGGSAFSDCSGLTSITIPASVESIGGYAFSGCRGLTSITIPASVTSIDGSAFSGCSGLTNITVTNGNTVYRSEENCLIKIADNTLILGCKNSVIPASVTSIGSYAFSGCSGLTSITIPASVTSIGAYAFSDCNGLTSVTFATGSNISSSNFGDFAFPPYNFSEGLKTVYLTSGGGAGTYTRPADGSAWTKQ